MLQRKKFLRRLSAVGVQVRDLVLGYAALARIVHPSSVPAVVEADPDDDMVLACALASRAAAIVSGDRHLLSLGEYQDIPILTPVRFLDL